MRKIAEAQLQQQKEEQAKREVELAKQQEQV
jgi:hypothetical protein